MSSATAISSRAVQAAKDGPPTAAGARAFVKRVNDELKLLQTRASTAEWIKNTYITDDTERNAALVNDELLAYTNKVVKEAARFTKVADDADTRRMLQLLRVSSSLAAPADPKARLELATLSARLEGHYGKAKACGADGKATTCRDIEELDLLFQNSRKEAELRDAWLGWHRTARETRPWFERFVVLANQGARDIGFADTGDMWRSAYDMTPAAFEAETDRLWQQVRPLYEQLHCYVRGALPRPTAPTRSPPTVRFPRICSATCGRRSGVTSTTSSRLTRANRRST